MTIWMQFGSERFQVKGVSTLVYRVDDALGVGEIQERAHHRRISS
jgi:hypothetical protein